MLQSGSNYFSGWLTYEYIIKKKKKFISFTDQQKIDLEINNEEMK
jgi:hypothetical protein